MCFYVLLGRTISGGSSEGHQRQSGCNDVDGVEAAGETRCRVE
jgi:hypothetical protein